MISTYLEDHKYTHRTSDAELNRLLAEVREKTGEDWRIRESIYRERRWFTTKVRKSYTLFVGVGGVEFQIINFYRPDRDGEHYPSINTNNDAGYIAAFLYGVLCGVRHKTEEPT